jgi:ssDNA-binding Zn-finger/Zn-ribbon topoisomerase 1
MVLRDSRYGKFFGCSRFPICRGTHGAHPDGTPLGIPANAATKLARMAAHGAFDGLWRSMGMRRNSAYHWLGQVLGMPRSEVHIGSFNSEQCARVVAAVEQMREEAGL